MDSLNDIIAAFRKFPGVGLKSARRMAFYLVKQDEEYLADLASKITGLKKGLFVCSQCGNVSSTNPCNICSDPMRDRKTLCVVEDIEAISTFEMAGIYNGLYHVLGGRVDPLRGEDLSGEAIDFLLSHIEKLKAEEVIIATTPRVEGDFVYYTLLDALKGTCAATISRLAFGLPVGGNIEFADKMTLHAALEARRKVS